MKVSMKKATPSDLVKPGLIPLKEGTQTTHYSVADRFGNAVSVTYTINDWYGSGVAVEGAGFLLNDEMDDFRQNQAYLICTASLAVMPMPLPPINGP